MTDQLGHELTRWAQSPEAAEARADAVVAAALAALPAQSRPVFRWRWDASAALAASVAAAVALLPMRDVQRPAAAVSAAAAQPAPEVFASLFVPTPEEEDHL